MLVKLPLTQKIQIILPAIVQHKFGWYGVIIETNSKGLKVVSFQHKKGMIVSYDKFRLDYMPDMVLMEKLSDVSYTIPPLSTTLKIWIKENMTNVGLGILLVMTLLSLYFHEPRVYALIILDCIGILISSLAFIADHQHYSSLYDKICRHNTSSQKSGCDPSDSVIPILGWRFSTLGLMYFCVNFLLLLSLPDGLPVTIWVFLPLGLVIVVYSIYKQYFILKKFCNICIIIIVLFLFKMVYIIYLSSIDLTIFSPNFEINEWLLHLLIFALIILSSAYITARNDANNIRNLQTKIWSEHQVIEKFSSKDEFVYSECNNNIVLGDPAAPIVIDLVIHVACTHCQAALNSMILLMLLNEKIKLRLYIRHSDKPSDYNMIVHCIEAVSQKAYFEILNIYQDWKAGKTNKYTPATLREITIKIIDSNRQFFIKTRIAQYPFILIDGRRIPGFVGFEDLKVAYSGF